MINGVSFQPGSFEQEQQRRQSQNGSAQGVQEAIKVLSLRLPKVVGAQAVSPQALLSSPGGGGNPQVNSLVENVLSQIFGQQRGKEPGAPAPMVPPVIGDRAGQSHPYAQPQSPSPAAAPEPQNYWDLFRPPSVPRIIPGDGPSYTPAPPPGMPPPGDFTQGPGGSPQGPGGGVGGIVDNYEPPDLRRFFDWLPVDPPPSETPLI